MPKERKQRPFIDMERALAVCTVEVSSLFPAPLALKGGEFWICRERKRERMKERERERRI